MRESITFRSQGLDCSGWLYTPEDLGPGQKAPAVVMAHGFSGVKEMALPFFAERFAGAGIVTLTFDFRYFGESEGETRGQVFPLEQQTDCRNAITWLSAHPLVDPQRIGIWGTSHGGAVALYAATWDKRIKAVVAQVPVAINGSIRRSLDPERFDRMGERLLRDRVARYRTGVVSYINVVAPEGEPCVLQSTDAYEWCMRWGARAPTWRNQVTLESLEKMREFDVLSQIHLISPTPVLMIAAQRDSLAPLGLVQAAFKRVHEPKALVVLPCGHFEVYDGEWAEKAADAAVEWFG